MSYGLNVEMHKQTEIGKRLDAIIRQVLPFLSGEHQQQVAMAVERAKQITMAELNAVMQVNKCDCMRARHALAKQIMKLHCSVLLTPMSRQRSACPDPVESLSNLGEGDVLVTC